MTGTPNAPNAGTPQHPPQAVARAFAIRLDSRCAGPESGVFFRPSPLDAPPGGSCAPLSGGGGRSKRGLLEMMQNGVYTLAEDESSSTVSDMPQEANERGTSRKVLPPTMIEAEIPRTRTTDGGA